MITEHVRTPNEIAYRNLKPEIDPDESGIVVTPAIRVRETHEYTGIILRPPGSPFELEDEVRRCRCRVPKKSKIRARNGFERTIHNDEASWIVVPGLIPDR